MQLVVNSYKMQKQQHGLHQDGEINVSCTAQWRLAGLCSVSVAFSRTRPHVSGQPAGRHIKAEQQSVPAAALCFCYAVLTQHGGPKALVVCPSAPWEAVLRIQLKAAQFSLLTNWKATQQPEADVLDLKYSFWSKDHSQFSSFCASLNGIFMWQRWLNIRKAVFPTLTYGKYVCYPCLKCRWITS